MMISIILPCFNCQETVADCIQSVLDQTLSEFELIIIDDGSEDKSVEIIKSFSDPRIKLFRNEVNLGLIDTLNRGIELANGEYIARIDADDICVPERLMTQVECFQSEPSLGMVSASCHVIDVDGRKIRTEQSRFRSPAEIRFWAHIGNPIVHPALMIRATLLKRFKFSDEPISLHVEDYELFSRLILSKNVMALNILEPLILRRVHSNSVSHKYEDVQKRNFTAISRNHCEVLLGRALSPVFHRVAVNRMIGTESLSELIAGIDLLQEIGEKCGSQNDAGVTRLLRNQILDIVAQSITKGGWLVKLKVLCIPLLYPRGLINRANIDYIISKF